MSEPDPHFPGYLFWADLETTGIDPDKASILEVSLRLTRGASILDRYHGVIGHPNVRGLEWDPRARRMHAGNGLLAEIADGHCEAFQAVQEGVLEFTLNALEHSGGEELWLAGCGPGFDRAFLRRFCPEATQLLHYRNFDLNALLRWYSIEKPQGFDRPHRSEGDLDQDWELFQQLLQAREALLCP